MIPLKDNTPRSSAPVVTVAIIIVNTLAFFYQLTIPNKLEPAFLMSYALVPARMTQMVGAPHVPLQVAFEPFLTSMFLHGGWLHLIGNMWFLWVFGDNVEDRLGHISYLFFYLFCGFGAGLAHFVANVGSAVPSLGASGAISGVLGAYIVLYPRAQVLTLVPLIIFWFTVEIPAFLVLGYWFVIQFVSGVASVGARNAGGVAWWAHIGGFVLGVLMVKMWPQRRQRVAYYEGY
ncbi:MAG TPA: rhomboid family intramembrane serine protease [Candidatus Acidoferrales bacterium]|nr:rhomboid family intramembrane serine protease [Candidatus Acidoferrales bacterium]